jgi:hypothetical protein
LPSPQLGPHTEAQAGFEQSTGLHIPAPLLELDDDEVLVTTVQCPPMHFSPEGHWESTEQPIAEQILPLHFVPAGHWESVVHASSEQKPALHFSPRGHWASMEQATSAQNPFMHR